MSEMFWKPLPRIQPIWSLSTGILTDMYSSSSRAFFTASAVWPVTVTILLPVLSLLFSSCRWISTPCFSRTLLMCSPFLPMILPTRLCSAVNTSLCWVLYHRWRSVSLSMSTSRCSWNRCISIWFLKCICRRSFSPRSTACSSPISRTWGGSGESGLATMFMQLETSSRPLFCTWLRQPMESWERIQMCSSLSTGMSRRTRADVSTEGSLFTRRRALRSTMRSCGPLLLPTKPMK
mmetsp:Transcript_122002/g.345791  ORF Transcript_122002/g.345791 Transcript_122002/m.345791 type:complete len:235 (-) Transcript_122002:332-1036(-)